MIPACRETYRDDSDAVDPEELLSNPGFEDWSGENPIAWMGNFVSAEQSLAPTDESPHEGALAMRTIIGGTPDEPAYAQVDQLIGVAHEAGTELEASVWMRCATTCDTIASSIVLHIGYVEPDQNGETYSLWLIDDAVAGPDFKQISGVVTVPRDSEYVIFSLTGTNGTFDFDDASLRVRP